MISAVLAVMWSGPLLLSFCEGRNVPEGELGRRRGAALSAAYRKDDCCAIGSKYSRQASLPLIRIVTSGLALFASPYVHFQPLLH
jgi:hypothetical protein